jgi:hypothetical protein
MFLSQWQIMKRVARGLLRVPQKPNIKLNVGIFSENMVSNPQVNFNLLKQQEPEIYTEVDTSYNFETGDGKIYVPFSDDGYKGEVLAYE